MVRALPLVGADEPADLGLLRGPRREHPLGRRVVGALQDERGVGDGVGHRMLPWSGWAWSGWAWSGWVGPGSATLDGGGLGRVGVLGQVVAEGVEPALPRAAALGDPPLGGAQRGRGDLAGAHPAHLLGAHQAARLQHLHVLDDGGERHREGPGQLADRGRSPAEPLDHQAPAGVGQRLEHPVERIRLVKHVLECTSESSERSSHDLTVLLPAPVRSPAASGRNGRTARCPRRYGVVTDSRTAWPGRHTFVVCFPSPKITKATWSMSMAKRSNSPSGRHAMASKSATQ